jgi:hypothetical protein
MPDNETVTPTGGENSGAETTEANELIMRYQFESYMKCQDSAFNLIGEGFTAFPLAMNPKEYTRKYINDKTERSDVIGYATSVGYSCDCIKGDPCVQEIVDITNNEVVGNDTHREIVNVDCWDEVSSGEFRATKRTYAIIPGNKGDGTDALIYTGTMKACSDLVKGTFNRETKLFTPASD